VVVIFGATGDLARRKLLPGLLHLSQAGLMSAFRVVGISLEDIDDEEFSLVAQSACGEFGRHQFSPEAWEEFAGRLTYVSNAAAPAELALTVAALGVGSRAAFYEMTGAYRDMVVTH
jgi:glucose-6-phosphate 1-dehydrogenase